MQRLSVGEYDQPPVQGDSTRRTAFAFCADLSRRFKSEIQVTSDGHSAYKFAVGSTFLTNAFSKKLENHCHMLAVTFMHYNFCRKHTTIKSTPAQAAGIADHQWTLEEVVEIFGF